MRNFIKKINFVNLILANGIFTLVVFLNCSCESDLSEEVTIEYEIAYSEELENMIIASYDMQRSIEELSKELNREGKGKEILSLINSCEGGILKLPLLTDLDNKVRIFNERKKDLLDKYPDFFSNSPETRNSLMKECLKNSRRVNREMLRLGYSPFQTRSYGDDWNEESYSSRDEAISDLNNSINDPNYVEALMYVFRDGTAKVITSSSSSAQHCNTVGIEKRNDLYYYTGHPSSPIDAIIHTHRDSKDPSITDQNQVSKYPGVKFGILYNGYVYYYGEPE